MATTVDGTSGLTLPGTGSVVLAGATSGTITLSAPAAAGNTTLTLPAVTGTVLGAGSALIQPQGRLTLVSETPVMTSAQAGKTTIYYTPYVGSTIPIYDGTNWTHARFAELSNITTNSSTGSAGPAATAANSNYDLFVWSSSGTLTLTRGPAWTSDTARGTGAGTTELTRTNGIWLNTVAITNGPGAGLGTYVGTIRTNGSAQIDLSFGGVAAAAMIGVWNAYNRVAVAGQVSDSTSSWNYTTATWRPANNSATNRVSFVSGLQEDSIHSQYQLHAGNTVQGPYWQIGIGLNSTTTASGMVGTGQTSGHSGPHLRPIAATSTSLVLGFNYLQAIEWAQAGAGTTTWYGAQSMGLTYQWRC